MYARRQLSLGTKYMYIDKYRCDHPMEQYSDIMYARKDRLSESNNCCKLQVDCPSGMHHLDDIINHTKHAINTFMPG